MVRILLTCQQEHVFESTLAALEKNNAANLPPLRNPPKMESEDDLTNLSHLNEPSGRVFSSFVGVCVCMYINREWIYI